MNTSLEQEVRAAAALIRSQITDMTFRRQGSELVAQLPPELEGLLRFFRILNRVKKDDFDQNQFLENLSKGLKELSEDSSWENFLPLVKCISEGGDRLVIPKSRIDALEIAMALSVLAGRAPLPKKIKYHATV